MESTGWCPAEFPMASVVLRESNLSKGRGTSGLVRVGPGGEGSSRPSGVLAGYAVPLAWNRRMRARPRMGIASPPRAATARAKDAGWPTRVRAMGRCSAIRASGRERWPMQSGPSWRGGTDGCYALRCCAWEVPGGAPGPLGEILRRALHPSTARRGTERLSISIFSPSGEGGQEKTAQSFAR